MFPTVHFTIAVFLLLGATPAGYVALFFAVVGTSLVLKRVYDDVKHMHELATFKAQIEEKMMGAKPKMSDRVTASKEGVSAGASTRL